MCDVLKIIDGILKKYGYEMLAKEYRQINLTNFMENLKNCEFTPQIKNEEIQLLSSEYDAQDFIGEKIT